MNLGRLPLTKKIPLILSLLLLPSCVHIHLVCPTSGVQMVGMGGNNLVNFIAGAAQGAAIAAPFLTKAPTPAKLAAAPVAEAGSTYDETTLDFFPATYYCGSQPPPAQTGNTTVIVNPQPTLAPSPVGH